MSGSAVLTEQWRPVPGYEGLYDVSDQGRVRSIPRTWTRGGILAAAPAGRTGYLTVNLTSDGRQKTSNVHHLVAAAFLDPRPDGHDVRHLNGNRTDNRRSNLAYGTRSVNNRDAVRHGTHHWAKKTHCPQGHPYDEENTRVYRGSRYCKACQRDRRKQRRAMADCPHRGGAR